MTTSQTCLEYYFRVFSFFRSWWKARICCSFKRCFPGNDWWVFSLWLRSPWACSLLFCNVNWPRLTNSAAYFVLQKEKYWELWTLWFVPLGKNEVTLEFHQHDDAQICLMEMRFYIPATSDGTSEDPVKVM